MSTLKATYLQQAASTNPNITLDGSANATVGGTLAMGSSFKRNRIINGNMAVWQRGTSFSSPSSTAYTADRWQVVYGGTAPTYAQTTGASGFQYALRITGIAGNSYAGIVQKIESINCVDLVGKTVTISANITVSSNQNVLYYLYYANAVDNFSAVTIAGTGTVSATTTATTLSVSVNNLPSGAANGLYLLIQANNGGAFTSGTIDITGVQLETGSIATPYEQQIYSDQLAQCYRYYERVGVYVGTSAWATIINGAASTVTKRASPTLTITNLGSGTGAAFTFSGGSSPYPNGMAYQTAANSTSASATLIMDAEL